MKDENWHRLQASLDAKLGPEPDKCDNLPRTKGINYKGYDTRPDAKWLKPASALVLGAIEALKTGRYEESTTKVGEVAPSPTLSNRPAHLYGRQGTPIRKEDRGRIMALARRLNADTREPGKQGALKATAIVVLETLLFRFWDHFTGQCNPAAETIAAAAGVSVRTVHRAKERLRAAGLLSWAATFVRGRQSSNRYRIGPECQSGVESPGSEIRRGFEKESFAVLVLKAAAKGINLAEEFLLRYRFIVL